MKKTLILFCCICSIIACTNKFEVINKNPNQPTEVIPDLLLSSTLTVLTQDQFNYTNGAGLARHLARTNYNEVEQYSFGTNEAVWNKYYLQMNNINDMIRISEQTNRPSCVAIAYVLKAFVISQITDLWGDVPYTEACSAPQNTSPTYDSQEKIYTAKGGILDLLEQAEILLQKNSDYLPQDIVYNGDRLKWRKLANSLRLRYLIRLNKRFNEVSERKLKEELVEVSKLPLIESNEDNFKLAFLSANPNRSPIYNLRAGEQEYIRMSQDIYEVLSTYNDPRMTVWFSPTSNSKRTDKFLYKGVPVGCSLTTLEKINYSGADVSLLGTYFTETPNACNAVLMNASEVMFLLSEAIARNYIVGDIKKYYENGIRLSMEYYSVKLEPEYLQQKGVLLEKESALEQIIEQKWLSLFFVGYEAWFDYLRTGFPSKSSLKDNRNPTETNGIPSRFYYPEDEQALNPFNYEINIKKQGGKDNINTKLWWEK